jgi:Protein of unknown function (DUF2490)
LITKQHIIFLALFIPVATKAQRKIEHTNMIWTGYYNIIRFNKKWSVGSDAQLRTRDWNEKWSQLLIRSGLSYAISDRAAVTTGFAFFKNAQYSGKQLFLKNEFRPWQEFSYQVKLNKINLIQRLRTEQRFLQQVVQNTKSNRYEYILRVRYKFEGQIPLKENKLKLLLGNEIMINPCYIHNSLFFDQNRTFAGLHYNMSPKTSVQCNYLKILQWRSNSSVLEDQNILRFNIYQEFNFKKKYVSK